jgi:hypothetical protein
MQLKKNDDDGYLSSLKIDQCLPENKYNGALIPLSLETSFWLYSGKGIPFNQSALKIEREEFEKLIKYEINSLMTGLFYTILFDKSNEGIKTIIIFNQSDNNNIQYIIDNLILKDGFVIKKCLMKNGRDIIVKETENNFIIGEIYEGMTPDCPSQLIISPYTKRKSFKAFFNY